MNEVVLTGRLTKNVELIEKGNIQLANFSLAVQRDYKNQKGDYEVDFIECSVFGAIAKTLSQCTNKGDLIGVRGSLRVNKWTTSDGKNRYSQVVNVSKVTFLSPKKKEQANVVVDESVQEDPFKDFGTEVNLTDEDLPF